MDENEKDAYQAVAHEMDTVQMPWCPARLTEVPTTS